MGGGKLVHVRIVVAAIFDFMTEEDWESSFNMALSREKNSRAGRKRLRCRLKARVKRATNFVTLLQSELNRPLWKTTIEYKRENEIIFLVVVLN